MRMYHGSAEYDHDRAKGKKLCVGAFFHDCDFPMYYGSYFLEPVDKKL